MLVDLAWFLRRRRRELAEEKRLERLSAEQAAELCDLSPGQYRYMESGARGAASPAVLRKLADGLECSYLDLAIEAGYLQRSDLDELSAESPGSWLVEEFDATTGHWRPLRGIGPATPGFILPRGGGQLRFRRRR